MTNEELVALIKKNPISVGCGVLCLAIAGGIYFRSDAIPAAEAELSQKTGEAERLATNIKYSAQLKEQFDALIAAGKEIDQGVVRASEVGKITGYFYKLESDTKLKLVDLRPVAATAAPKGGKSSYSPVGYIVSVQGSQTQILDFLRQLEGGSRYCRVLTATVAGTATNRKGPLTLTLSLEMLGLP